MTTESFPTYEQLKAGWLQMQAERDQYKTWWERDSRGLGTTLNELSMLRAVKQDQQAQIKRLRRALEELCRRGRCPIAEEALGLDKRYPE